MPDIGSITRQKIVTTELDMGDGEMVTIHFDRNRVTPHWAAEAGRRDETSDPLSMPKALADVILEWDITADGQPFPPTVENLAVLSYPLQSALLQHVLGASVPSESEGKASASPPPTPSSDSTPAPAPFPNGTATSTSGAPSVYPSPT